MVTRQSHPLRLSSFTTTFLKLPGLILKDWGIVVMLKSPEFEMDVAVTGSVTDW